MSNPGNSSPPRIVQTLQSPTSVVTYRAVVGLLIAATTGMVAFIGSALMDGQNKLQDTMVKVQLSVARNTGKIEDQGTRLQRVENSVDTLADRSNLLDHRITVVEAHEGMK